jgi:hypothetical protein
MIGCCEACCQTEWRKGGNGQTVSGRLPGKCKKAALTPFNRQRAKFKTTAKLTQVR